ncbi:Oxoglutarate/iron-dependent dioxygenase [Sesbania bispinosa]|nr:Oxoglutarate/iron-dependent dioxygenase [Sesbania bispinosa]
MDRKLVSSWYDLHSSVPSSYVQPPERRPGNAVLATNKTIPVIDLEGLDRADIIRNIIKSSEEYGFFQVINHGVPKELVDNTLRIFKEFHAMSVDEKVRESSKDPNGREIVGKYTQELRMLGLKILGLISEGLGLNPNYFSRELSESPIVISHHYPPCPEPSLTLGASRHKDPNILTLLYQEAEITALQVFKDGAWIPIEPISNAFVVNMGFMLQIISNGRLIGAEHRVITNSSTGRHTIAYFINPTKDALIEPAKPLLSATSPPIYPSMTFGKLLENFLNKGPYFEAEFRI